MEPITKPVTSDYKPLFRTAQHPTVTAPETAAKDGGAGTLAVAPDAWFAMQWHEKLIHCSERLGITWEWLPDGRLRLSRWDKELVREALTLFRQIDQELGYGNNTHG